MEMTLYSSLIISLVRTILFLDIPDLITSLIKKGYTMRKKENYLLIGKVVLNICDKNKQIFQLVAITTGENKFPMLNREIRNICMVQYFLHLIK